MTTIAAPRRPEPPPAGPPVNGWHLLAARCGLHPLRLTARQVVVIRRLDTARSVDGVDPDRLAALEAGVRTAAAGHADRRMVRAADRARGRPLTRLRRERTVGAQLTTTLLREIQRNHELNRFRYRELKPTLDERRRTGERELRPLTGRWRVLLPLLLPLEVLFSAALYARVADLELAQLATWSLPSAVAWGVMLLIAAVTALAVHLAGRRLADRPPVDPLGYARPRLVHAAVPGLVVMIVSGFYGSSAFVRMQGLLAERSFRGGELSAVLPWTYGVLLGLTPVLIAWSIARAHTPEQDELRRSRREERAATATENGLLRRIDRRLAANQRREDDLRGRHQRARTVAAGIIDHADGAIEIYRGHLAGAGLHPPTAGRARAELAAVPGHDDPWADLLAELHPDAEGRSWTGLAAAIKQHLATRGSRPAADRSEDHPRT